VDGERNQFRTQPFSLLAPTSSPSNTDINDEGGFISYAVGADIPRPDGHRSPSNDPPTTALDRFNGELLWET
jgi:hypothetical protein